MMTIVETRTARMTVMVLVTLIATRTVIVSSVFESRSFVYNVD